MVKTDVKVVSDTEVHITREFKAPRALVWKVMTEPEYIRRWYGMKIFTVSVCEVDLKVGGKWRFVLVAPDGSEHAYSGEYRELAVPERSVYTENYEPIGPGHEMVVSADFRESRGGTVLVTRLQYQSQADRDAHLQAGMEKGMRESTDRLGELLEELSKEVPLSPRWANFTVGASLVFLALLGVLHAVRLDLNPAMHFISEYEVGPTGWLMQLAFLALAASCVGMIVLVFPLSKSVVGVLGMLCLVVSASGMLLAGLVPPGPVPGLHDLGATLDMVPLAALLLSLRLMRVEPWRSRRGQLWLLAALPLAAFVLYGAAMAATLPGLHWDPAVGAPVGWPNRLMVIVQAGWLATVAWRFR